MLSLVVFRSLTAAVLVAAPGIAAGAVVLGFMGLVGAPVTVLSNVVPALVMILGYADAMHLSHAWRHHRDRGALALEAERRHSATSAAACMLTALTVAGAFLSLSFTDIALVREFAFLGAAAMVAGCAVVLVVHALAAIAIGRFWQDAGRGAGDVLAADGGAQRRAWARSWCAARGRSRCSLGVAFVVFGAMYLSVPPEHTIREHLPSDNVANAALGRFDQNFRRRLPGEILIPLDGLDPTSPAALARVGAVHRAVAAVPGVHTPLSLWSLVDWLGGAADEATSAKLKALLALARPETVSRLLSADGTALLTVSTEEAPSRVTAALIDGIEAATAAANGGRPLTVTGVTVLTAREAARTINSLNGSLSIAVFGDIFLMVLAFRNLAIGIVSVIANTLAAVRGRRAAPCPGDRECSWKLWWL